jgi:hypothetical protein
MMQSSRAYRGDSKHIADTDLRGRNNAEFDRGRLHTQ